MSQMLFLYHYNLCDLTWLQKNCLSGCTKKLLNHPWCFSEVLLLVRFTSSSLECKPCSLLVCLLIFLLAHLFVCLVCLFFHFFLRLFILSLGCNILSWFFAELICLLCINLQYSFWFALWVGQRFVNLMSKV